MYCRSGIQAERSYVEWSVGPTSILVLYLDPPGIEIRQNTYEL